VLTVLRKRLARDDERGFTLIELMVVVLIIAILIAIAIPTFLGARERAQERSAQSNLRNGLTAAKTIYTDSEDYTAATPGDAGTLEDAAPELTFVNGALPAASDNDTLSVATSANRIQFVVRAANGDCFSITDDVNSGTSDADVPDDNCTPAV
jgi:type IV pilus assembly protein PilA